MDRASTQASGRAWARPVLRRAQRPSPPWVARVSSQASSTGCGASALARRWASVGGVTCRLPADAVNVVDSTVRPVVRWAICTGCLPASCSCHGPGRSWPGFNRACSLSMLACQSRGAAPRAVARPACRAVSICAVCVPRFAWPVRVRLACSGEPLRARRSSGSSSACSGGVLAGR